MSVKTLVLVIVAVLGVVGSAGAQTLVPVPQSPYLPYEQQPMYAQPYVPQQMVPVYRQPQMVPQAPFAVPQMMRQPDFIHLHVWEKQQYNNYLQEGFYVNPTTGWYQRDLPNYRCVPMLPYCAR